MGKNIKGITIEINGETKGLTKALKEANVEIKNANEHLKAIDRALKLDPTNIDMIKAKQNALNEVIAETKKRLDIEKQAAEKAKKELELGNITQSEYDALQAEIVTTTDKLKGLEKQADETEKELKMSEASGGYDTLQSETDAATGKLKDLENQAKQTASSIESNMQNAADKMYELGDMIESVGHKIEDAGKTMTAKVTMPIVKAGKSALTTSADFESAMSEVGAISGASAEDMEILTEKAMEMGRTTAFSASESAEALKYMAMAGWKTEEMTEGIAGIMNLAAASGEELGTTSDIVTDALTAFGLQASDSARFADVLAAASSNANTNVSLMGESFKYVAATAGAAGYDIEEVAVALGIMANGGIKGSQAGTALRNTIVNLAKPTDQQLDAMEKLGLSLTDSSGNMKSLTELMGDLRASFKGLSADEQEAMAATIAGKQSMAGLLTLVNASDEDFNKFTAAINNSSGAAEEMADKMLNNLNGQITLLKSAIEGVAISIGNILMPYVKEAVEWIQKAVDKINNMSESQKKLIVVIAGIVAVIGPLLIFTGKLIASVGFITEGISKLIKFGGKILPGIKNIGLFIKGTLIPSISGLISTIAPFVPVILAVIAAITAVIVVIKNWDAIVELAQIIWEEFTTKVSELGEKLCNFLTEAFEKLKEFFKEVWDGIKDTALNAWDNIKETFSKVGEWFTDKFQAAYDGITGLFDKLGGFFKGVWDDITGIFEYAGTAIKDAISGAVTLAINNLLSTAGGIINGFISAINGAINIINKIPKVSVPKLSKLDIPQLAKGGILKKGQVGLLEGNGAEAVVPLDQNKKWIKAVAGELKANTANMARLAHESGTNKASANAKAAVAGDIIIPVYIGQDKIQDYVIKANQINNYRSGGR